MRLDDPLPFDLRDAQGRVRLPAGRALHYPTQIEALLREPLLAHESELAAWMGRLPTAALAPLPALLRHWHELVDQLDATLSAQRRGSAWRAGLFAVHGRARGLHEQQPDGSLYHLVYEAGSSLRKYSCQHALLSLVVAEQAARRLGWPLAWIDSLGRAALTMNIAMRTLQDELALASQPPSPAQRALIAGHAEAGATMLDDIGLGDALCTAVVRGHHDASGDGELLSALPPERQLALLLRRVDIFTAKISRRAARTPMSPVRAAREACLGPDGKPDAIGNALLQGVGVYPPGSFVALANGETAIVVARGERAALPRVAALVSSRGSPLGEPLLRDTQDERFAVARAVNPSQVRVQPAHDRVMALT